VLHPHERFINVGVSWLSEFTGIVVSSYGKLKIIIKYAHLVRIQSIDKPLSRLCQFFNSCWNDDYRKRGVLVRFALLYNERRS
jgi:hypothetical protein